MAESEQSIPIGMMAARLHRATQVDCIARLNRAGYTDLRMRHLATQTGMSKQAMGELIDEIEANGYIERQNDPADRRARLIVFTAKGQRAYEEAFAVLGEMERDYAATVGKSRYSQTRTALDELVSSLESTNR
jgi:DNA-binding MarR family transcriptional regulator